jgi:uncharacterized protein YhfF
VIPARVRPFWKSFSESAGKDVTSRFYEAFHFDDNEPSANELAALVLAGTKRATASLLWTFEAASKRMPAPGDLSVMTNWSGTPLCVIETQRVDVVPYEEVGAEFAATEGEGDGSLHFWREAHWRFFGRECARIGRTLDRRMPVVCERFEVVYRG